MSLINGWSGQYTNNNAINRGKNAGQKVANAARNNPQSLANADIQYTTKENGKFSLDGGLAYSMESLKGLDQNGDGVVSTRETGPLGQVIDLNNDGKISASENLSYTMYQDSAGKLDGVVTAKERNAADQALMADPAKARAQMQKLHQGHNMAQKEEDLKQKEGMQNNPMMQFFQQMIQAFMQMFGMGQQNNASSYNNNNSNYATASASSNNGSSFSFATASGFGAQNGGQINISELLTSINTGMQNI